MSYKDYFELEDLAYEVQIGKRSLGDAVELAEMCLGVELPEILGLNESFSKKFQSV